MTEFIRANHPIALSANVLEDILPAPLVRDLDLSRAFMPPRLLSWWRSVLVDLAATADFSAPRINPELAMHADGATGGAQISLLFCSRTSLRH